MKTLCRNGKFSPSKGETATQLAKDQLFESLMFQSKPCQCVFAGFSVKTHVFGTSIIQPHIKDQHIQKLKLCNSAFQVIKKAMEKRENIRGKWRVTESIHICFAILILWKFPVLISCSWIPRPIRVALHPMDLYLCPWQRSPLGPQRKHSRVDGIRQWLHSCLPVGAGSSLC